MKIRQINFYSIVTAIFNVVWFIFCIWVRVEKYNFWDPAFIGSWILLQIGFIYMFCYAYRTIHINKKGIQEKFWFITFQSINWDEVECIFKFTIPLEGYKALCVSKIKFKKFDLDDYHDPKIAKQMMVFEYTEKTYDKFVKYMTENVPSKLYLLEDFNSLNWIKEDDEVDNLN